MSQSCPPTQREGWGVAFNRKGPPSEAGPFLPAWNLEFSVLEPLPLGREGSGKVWLQMTQQEGIVGIAGKGFFLVPLRLREETVTDCSDPMCPLPSRVESYVFPEGPLSLGPPLCSLCRPLEPSAGPSSLFAGRKLRLREEEEPGTPASVLSWDVACSDPGARPCGFRPWWRLWLSRAIHPVSPAPGPEPGM